MGGYVRRWLHQWRTCSYLSSGPVSLIPLCFTTMRHGRHTQFVARHSSTKGSTKQRQEKSLDNRSGRAGQTLFRMSEHESGCPTLRAVRSVGIWQFELMTEHEIEIRGTHLSKTAKGGATGHLQLCIQKRRVYPITLLASSRYMRARRRASAGSMTRNQNIVLRPRE